MRLVRYADRSDLRAIRFDTLSRRTFPEYMHHNEPGGRYWGRLYDERPDFQLALLDGEELVAELHSVPTPWDGSEADLPSGWDEAFTRAFESERPGDVLWRSPSRCCRSARASGSRAAWWPACASLPYDTACAL